MTKQSVPKPTYQELTNELADILSRLQQEDLEVDEALSCYERGLRLVSQLEAYLAAAENRVIELKSKFADES